MFNFITLSPAAGFFLKLPITDLAPVSIDGDKLNWELLESVGAKNVP